MTILPKKKATKDKTDSENTEHAAHSGVGHPHPHTHGHAHAHSHTHGHSLAHPHAHGHYHHATAADTRLDKAGRGRTSPTRWGPSTSREEKLHPNTPAFDFDFESHDSSSNHKRRHRSSPHRTVRKHRGAHSGHSSTGQVSPGTSTAYELEDGYNSEDEHVAPPSVPENREEVLIFGHNVHRTKRQCLASLGCQLIACCRVLKPCNISEEVC